MHILSQKNKLLDVLKYSLLIFMKYLLVTSRRVEPLHFDDSGYQKIDQVYSFVENSSFIEEPVLRLHCISPMARSIPSNPPMAMYVQYVATGRKSQEANYSEFHSNPLVVHRWNKPGHQWEWEIFGKKLN